jgi:membrane protease YdiL (CAAX protease family)
MRHGDRRPEDGRDRGLHRARARGSDRPLARAGDRGGVSTWLVWRAMAPVATEFVVAVVAEVYLAMIVALIVVSGGLGRMTVRLRFRFSSASDLGLALGTLVLTALAIVAVYAALSPLAGGPRSMAIQGLRSVTDMPRLPSASVATLALIFVRVWVLVGLGEELFFRGALYGWLRRRLSVPATIVVSGLAFTAEHAVAPLVLPAALLFGIAAGWVRHRTGSTLNTFVMHALFDGTLLVVAAVLVARHVSS